MPCRCSASPRPLYVVIAMFVFIIIFLKNFHWLFTLKSWYWRRLLSICRRFMYDECMWGVGSTHNNIIVVCLIRHTTFVFVCVTLLFTANSCPPLSNAKCGSVFAHGGHTRARVFSLFCIGIVCVDCVWIVRCLLSDFILLKCWLSLSVLMTLSFVLG